MKPIRMLPGSLASAWGKIPLVDRCLLVFMVLLLFQSAYSLFFPAAGEAAGDIDIIVRTSAAAIFGYFLSANFAGGSSGAGQEPDVEPAHIMELADDTPPAGPEARRAIGFVTAGDPPLEGGDAQFRTQPGRTETPAGCGLQVGVTAGIGLFCLAVLLLLRNTGQVSPLGDGGTATVAQLRDFVSGCVGFLIGYPARTSGRTT